jgi:hypothetical protein
MASEKPMWRECRDCTWWTGRSCSIDDVRSKKKECRGCDFFIRDSLRYAFFLKV